MVSPTKNVHYTKAPIPQHSDRYGVRVRRTQPATGIYTKVSVVPSRPAIKKTTTFST